MPYFSASCVSDWRDPGVSLAFFFIIFILERNSFFSFCQLLLMLLLWVQQTFLVSLILKSESCRMSSSGLLLHGLEDDLLIQLYLYKLCVVEGFLHCLIFKISFLWFESLAGWDFSMRLSLPWFHLASVFSLNLLSPWALDLAQLYFLLLSLLSKYTFCIYFCNIYFFWKWTL